MLSFILAVISRCCYNVVLPLFWRGPEELNNNKWETLEWIHITHQYTYSISIRPNEGETLQSRFGPKLHWCWFGWFFLGVYVEEHFYHECFGEDPLLEAWSAVSHTPAQPSAVDRKPKVQHDFSERGHLPSCHWRPEHLQHPVRLVQQFSLCFMFRGILSLIYWMDFWSYSHLFTLTVYSKDKLRPLMHLNGSVFSSLLICDCRMSAWSQGLGFNTSSLSSLGINITSPGRT